MKHRADAADEKSKEQKERINELETQVIQAQTAQKAAETKQAELQAAADELTAAKTKLEEDLATARQETADAVQALEDYKKEFLVEQKARLKAEANMREMRDENRRVITQVVDGEMEKLVTKVDGVGAKAKEGLEKQDKSWDGLNAGAGRVCRRAERQDGRRQEGVQGLVR
jgi:chromosome segregation ATPase